MRAVNLLPRDQAQRTIKKESLPVLIGACSGVLLAAAIGSMFMMGSGKVAAQQRKVARPNGSGRMAGSMVNSARRAKAGLVPQLRLASPQPSAGCLLRLHRPVREGLLRHAAIE